MQSFGSPAKSGGRVAIFAGWLGTGVAVCVVGFGDGTTGCAGGLAAAHDCAVGGFGEGSVVWTVGLATLAEVAGCPGVVGCVRGFGAGIGGCVGGEEVVGCRTRVGVGDGRPLGIISLIVSASCQWSYSNIRRWILGVSYRMNPRVKE
jgi:hypothetical protein